MTARRAVFAAIGSALLSGCQFFFPTPIDQDAEATEPSQVVHAAGSSFEEGEHIEAEVFLDAVSSGKGTLRVGRRCLADGKTALPIETDARSIGLATLFGDADAETFGLLDPDDNVPLEAHYDVTFNDKRTVTELDFKAGGYRQHQTRYDGDKPPKDSSRAVTLPTEQTPHDGHSLLGYLRRWEPAPGTRGHLYVIMGRNLYRTDLLFVGPEVLTTKRGPTKTFRIDGVATKINEKTLETAKHSPSHPFSLWMGADEPRVPQRILVESDLAKITIELGNYGKDDLPAADPLPCEKRVDKKALAKPPPKPRLRKPGEPVIRPKMPWETD
ncbi:MAG TPA: DUF3108 domain-containing protein [Polyangiaceae bacterium]|nr:DUF3108 domain-containing protein [Polyangiaceae bacterium]